MISRRIFLKAGGVSLLSVFSGVSQANELSAKQTQQQSVDIKPYKEVAYNPHDRKKAILAFSFTCPYCRNYDGLVSSWGDTLPSDFLSFERLPIVVDKESMMGATAYYAFAKAVKGDKRLIDGFVNRAFSIIQDERKSPLDPETWRKAGAVMIDANSVKSQVINAAEKVASYQIEKTPSLIIGGKYMINPNDAAGKEDLFIQLANGVSSIVLHEMGYRG